MTGPLPKDPALRQRRNQAASRATLPATLKKLRRTRPLPARSEGLTWHKLTLAWWRDIWHSPMAGEYLDADVHALYRLAVLIDMFWTEPGRELAAEITKEQQSFGLSPLDRRRLEWIVEKAEEAAERKRGQRRPVSHTPADDPRRALLSIVS
ncbi:MAG: hypothetical protein Q7O66_06730 [Dehalococcoidia bacterium]|nr:hypothetical protein [Dehalococcoidia bacterium]